MSKKIFENPDGSYKVAPTETQVYNENEFLSEGLVDWTQDNVNFVAFRAMTNRIVNRETGLYWTFDRLETLGGDGPVPLGRYEETQRIDFNTGSARYVTEQYGYGRPMTDEDRAAEDEGLNIQERTARRLQTWMLREADQKFGTTFMVDNVWNNGTANKTTGTDLNLASTSADILGKMDAAKEGILTLTGEVANSAVMTLKVFNALKRHEEIREIMDRGNAETSNPLLVAEQAVASALDLQNIYVMRGTDGAKLIGGDKILVYYKTDDDGPTAATRFSWDGLGPGGFATRTFREEGKRATVMELFANYSFNQVTSESGWLFNVTIPTP